jgi:hypothetical protein
MKPRNLGMNGGMMNVEKQWKRNLARMKCINRKTRINQNDYIKKKEDC